MHLLLAVAIGLWASAAPPPLKLEQRAFTPRLGEVSPGRVEAIAPTGDGLLVAINGSGDARGTSACRLLLLDASGTIHHRSRELHGHSTRCHGIRSAGDHQIVVGQTVAGPGKEPQAWITAVTRPGRPAWKLEHGGAGHEAAHDALQSKKTGLVLVAGVTGSKGSGEADALVLVVDPRGGLLGQHTYGGAGDQAAVALTETRDGDYLLAGHSAGEAGSPDPWLVRLDPNGEVRWQKRYPDEQRGGVIAVRELEDERLLLAGSRNGHAWAARTDASGTIQVQHWWKGQRAAVAIPSDDGFFIAGGRWLASADAALESRQARLAPGVQALALKGDELVAGGGQGRSKRPRPWLARYSMK